MACYTNNNIFYKNFIKDLNVVSLKSKEAKADDEEVKSCTLKIGLTKLL